MATNPYLADQATAITNRVNNNLTQNLLPQIGSAANAVGGYGGSRQGVAEGLAISQTNQGLGDSLANLYGNQYNLDQNRELQSRALDNQYNLGLGGLGLQNQLQNFNFYTQQRGLDQSGAQLGANLYNLGISGPWNATNQYANVLSPFSGLGGSQSQTQNGSMLGAISGGAILGSQLANGIGNLGLGSKMMPQPYQSGAYNDVYGYGSPFGG